MNNHPSNDGYWWRVLRAGDRLINAWCGGNDFCTISGRCGHLSEHSRNPLWKVYAWLIDWAFAPVESGHCAAARDWERNQLAEAHGYEIGSDLARALLGLILIIGCPVIGLITRCYAIYTRFIR